MNYEWTGAPRLFAGGSIITGNPKALEFSKSPEFTEHINKAKEIIKKHEPDYGRDD
jgi:hypothetical protein